MKRLASFGFVVLFMASFAPVRNSAAAECVAVPQSLSQTLQQHGWGVPGSYVAALHSLTGGASPEAIVLLTGQQFCGSGGCTLLVLQRRGVGWRLVSKVTLVRPPIRVLPTRNNRWATLSVQVQGVGVMSGYTALLPFQGSGYPTNPTAPPAIRERGAPAGSVLISSNHCQVAERG